MKFQPEAARYKKPTNSYCKLLQERIDKATPRRH